MVDAVNLNACPTSALLTLLFLVAASSGASANATITRLGQSWDFDDVLAPALPAGWFQQSEGAAPAWSTDNEWTYSAPNSAHVPALETAGEALLYSPRVRLASDDVELRFRHRWVVETSAYDGGVLEVAIDGGSFSDIVAAGGSFLAGAYNTTLFACCGGNPLGGRQAWSSPSQTSFMTTRVALPASSRGRDVQFRWRFGTDSSTTAPGSHGWWIDSIEIGAGGPQAPTLELGAQPLALSAAEHSTTAIPVRIGNAGVEALSYAVGTAATSEACMAPLHLDWLRSTPALGSLAGGAAQTLWLSANADGLPVGQANAWLCVESNDTQQPVVAVPVAFDVVAGVIDTLFCAGFDSNDNGICAARGDIVRSGPLNWPVPRDYAGLAIDLVSGEHGPATGARAHVNLYAPLPNSNRLYVYWYSDVTPEAFVAGVVEVPASGGSQYAVLQRHAVVGPSVLLSNVSGALNNWSIGATGYLAFQFWNAEAGRLNFGYLHLQTSSDEGFPAVVLDYGYNRSGDPIAIP